MNCPVCDHPLIILELNQIEIDYCTSCHGIWLDEGELELMLQNSDVKNKFLESFSVDKSSREKFIRCPICLKKMEKVICGDSKRITLDKCKQQHGIWFNKGELQDVVEMGSINKNDKVVLLLKEMFAHNLK